MMSKTKLCDSSNKAKKIQDPFCRDLVHKASICEHFEPIRCKSFVEKRTCDQDLYGPSGMHTLGAKV